MMNIGSNGAHAAMETWFIPSAKIIVYGAASYLTGNWRSDFPSKEPEAAGLQRYVWMLVTRGVEAGHDVKNLDGGYRQVGVSVVVWLGEPSMQ